MFNFFDYFILTPLRLFFQGMYEVILIFISNYGVGIIGLSCVTALILIPIEKAVRGSILKEKKVESVLQPQLTEIKHKYSGIDKNNAIKRLYTRYGYSPLYAIRNVYGVLIQLPFLIGAYLMLSSYDHLNGQSFLFIKDLSMQDQLLGKVNLLPILMTVVNLSTLLFLNLSKKENIQTGVIAFVFLILLYTAPSALLLYWTMNNVIHLLRAFWKKYIRFDIHKKKIIKYLKIAIEGISQTKIGYYLNNQLIEKTNREFFKKNWFVFLFLCCTLSLFINGFKNLGYYSPDDISRSIIFTSFLLIIISPFLYVIKNIGRNIKLFRLFFIIVILIFGSTYYYKTAGYIIVEDLPRFSRIISILSMFVIFYIIGGIKFVNIVLVVNVLLVVIFGVYNNYDSQKDFLSNIDETNKEDIVLNDRPNFYYILCESMNSLDIAITEYGFEKKYAEEFVDFLKNKGFYTPDYVYSNGSHTLKTLQTIFLMRDYIAGNKGNSDGSTSVRPMIAGSKYNKLLKILKNNGYYTSSYLPSQYFCSTKGPLLDFYDASELSNTTLQLAEGQPFLKNVVKTIAKKVINKKNLETDSYKIIDSYFVSEPKQPHFFLHRLAFTGHTSENVLTEEARDLFREKYLKKYKKEINALKYMITQILEHDKNAIIVLCGDHGAYLYRTNEQLQNTKNLINELKLMNISYEDFINDKFKVFAAIRIPKKYKQIQEKFSPGNVFAKIFNVIGYKGNEVNICENNSYYDGYVKASNPVITEEKIVPLEKLP